MDRDAIITRARRKLAEPPTGGYWSATDYEDTVIDGVRDFSTRVKDLKTCATFTTTADTVLYDVSEDSLDNMLDISELYFFTSTNDYDVLKPVTRDELAARQGGSLSGSGTPTCYCYEDRVIEFDCKQSAGLTVKIYYYKIPTLTSMTAGSDTPDTTEKFHEALVYYVCWQFAESDPGQTDKIQYFKGAYLEAAMRFKAILDVPASTYQGIIDDTVM